MMHLRWLPAAIALRLLAASIMLAAPALAKPAPSAAKPATTPAATAQAQAAWRQQMAQRPQPGAGCFEASYPDPAWHAVKCAAPPAKPQADAAIFKPKVVGGNSTDYAAVVAGTVSSMTGSFDDVEGVTRLTGGPGSQSNFALQLNTNTFPTSACQGANCLGWTQFIYSNTGSIYIEYTLINYGPDCPNNWSSYPPGFGKACFFNTPATPVPVQSPGDLVNLSLTGTAAVNGNDTVMLATSPTKIYSASYTDNVLHLSQGWGGASGATEFNIVGDTSASQTNFNPGSRLRVRLTNNASSPQVAPTCNPNGGTTAETNNLNLGGDCATSGQSIVFTEANTPLVTSISPTTGPATGGSTITLKGSGFTGATSVTFSQGVFPATPASFTVVADDTITAVSPPCPPTTCAIGTFGDIVTVTGPTGSGSALQGFHPFPVVTSVNPSSGPPGTAVTVTGNGFSLVPSHAFTFGSLPATDVDCSINGNVACTMVVPGSGSTSGQVRVTLADSTSGAVFTYTGGPVATCSLQVLGCPAEGGNQLYSVTCGVPHDFSVDRIFQTTGLSYTGQEAGAHQTTGIQACFAHTSQCQQFATQATEICPIHPPVPPTKPLPNCRVCTETGRPCMAVPGGFRCVGLIQ